MEGKTIKRSDAAIGLETKTVGGSLPKEALDGKYLGLSAQPQKTVGLKSAPPIAALLSCRIVAVAKQPICSSIIFPSTMTVISISVFRKSLVPGVVRK